MKQNDKWKVGKHVGGYKISQYLCTSPDGCVDSYCVYKEGIEGEEYLLRICNPESPVYLYRKEQPEGGMLEQKLGGALDGCRAFHDFVESGTIRVDGVEYNFWVRRYSNSDECLADLIECGLSFSWDEAAYIVCQVLEGMQWIHSLQPTVLLNNLVPDNLLVNHDGRRGWNVKITNLDFMSYKVNGRLPFGTNHLNLCCHAPETYMRLLDEQTDVYSAGALLYTLLMGHEPDVLPEKPECMYDEKPLRPSQKNVVKRMLSVDADDRYKTAEEALNALEDVMEDESFVTKGNERLADRFAVMIADDEAVPDSKVKSSAGFDDVAGMEELKEMLRRDVLFVLDNKEKAARYRLRIPNGMLLYGPPGCGKTFFAEKFAEESQMHCMMVKGSDLGSIYMHGTQERIAETFKEAEKNAPTVLCFDELDGMVPDRKTLESSGEHYAGEVNEFLSQLNNCSERGIFVIGTTNRPERIDPCLLRTGRLDRMVYVPIPDKEARSALFEMCMKERFCDEAIDYGELAELSEGYVPSDIDYIVNDAAIEAAMADVPISQTLLLEAIRKTRQSVSSDDVKEYERLRDKYERLSPNGRKRIGFFMSN